LLLNLPKIGIPDAELFGRVRTLHLLRVSPRGNRGFRPTLANGFIASLRVVGPIAGNLTHRPRNLRQQPRQDLTIMHVARGNLHGYNLFRLLVNSQMEFAPDPSVTTAMLVDMPLPCPVNSKTGGINDNVTGPATW
jgi:hypothetical protein